MRPITLNVNLDAASTTKVAAAQTVLINAALTLTAAATAGIDSSGAARILLITTTEDDSSGNLVIVGTDADGNSITETIAMPNSTTKSSTKAYKTVTSITTTIAITANISIGTIGSTLSAISKTLPLNYYAQAGATVACIHTGTIVYTIQETYDPILVNGTTSATWFSGSLNNDTQNTSGSGTVGANLVSISSADARSQLDAGVTGIRVSIASYNSSATLKIYVNSEHNAVG